MMRTQFVANVNRLIATFHGGNVREAARHTGVPQQTLNRIAHGNFRVSPRADTVQAIANAYPGVTADWLLSGEGELVVPDVPLDPAGRLWVNPMELICGG